MANKESTCEGGDVRWCAPEKENNGQFTIIYLKKKQQLAIKKLSLSD